MDDDYVWQFQSGSDFMISLSSAHAGQMTTRCLCSICLHHMLPLKINNPFPLFPLLSIMLTGIQHRAHDTKTEESFFWNSSNFSPKRDVWKIMQCCVLLFSPSHYSPAVRFPLCSQLKSLIILSSSPHQEEPLYSTSRLHSGDGSKLVFLGVFIQTRVILTVLTHTVTDRSQWDATVGKAPCTSTASCGWSGCSSLCLHKGSLCVPSVCGWVRACLIQYAHISFQKSVYGWVCVFVPCYLHPPPAPHCCCTLVMRWAWRGERLQGEGGERSETFPQLVFPVFLPGLCDVLIFQRDGGFFLCTSRWKVLLGAAGSSLYSVLSPPPKK